MNQSKWLLLAAGLVASSALFAESRAAENIVSPGADKARSCVACHNAIISLKGRGPSVLLRRIKDIREGNKIHKPDLDTLNEADLMEIAVFLNGS
ncbi:MAG: c-type cytochrome [Burkholderiaceae bacterium]